MPALDAWYTLNYANGCRADTTVYRGDAIQLGQRANDLSVKKNREIHVRMNWMQGSNTHYMTVSIHKDGKKIR